MGRTENGDVVTREFCNEQLLSAAAAIVIFGSALTPAVAQQPSPKGPPQTMGEEGKLPATGTVGGATPEMGATPPKEMGASKRMGDEGKLPATGTMSGATPKMNSPADK